MKALNPSPSLRTISTFSSDMAHAVASPRLAGHHLTRLEDLDRGRLRSLRRRAHHLDHRGHKAALQEALPLLFGLPDVDGPHLAVAGRAPGVRDQPVRHLASELLVDLVVLVSCCLDLLDHDHGHVRSPSWVIHRPVPMLGAVVFSQRTAWAATQQAAAFHAKRYCFSSKADVLARATPCR